MYGKYCMLRDSNGLTDYAVAVGAGINQATFYSWIRRAKEDESKTLSLTEAQKLAKFFHVTVDFFLKK